MAARCRSTCPRWGWGAGTRRGGPPTTRPRPLDRDREGVGTFVAPLPGTVRSAGRLVVLGVERSPDDFQRVALQHAAGVIALEQLNLRHADQLQFRTRGALLSDLAAGREAE